MKDRHDPGNTTQKFKASDRGCLGAISRFIIQVRSIAQIYLCYFFPLPLSIIGSCACIQRRFSNQQSSSLETSTGMALPSRLSLIILATCFFTPILASSSDELCASPDFNPTKPFEPWFKAWTNVTSGPGGDLPDYVNNMACWWYADCIFGLVAETRKQQYGAISIVMALIPLILKDIAWPEQRLVMISSQRNWAIEIIVRGLGLNPVIPKDPTQFKAGKLFHPIISTLILLFLVAFLVVSYGFLALMEVYSKRSSLGCPVPAFVVLWFVVGLAPATVEVAIGRFLNRNSAGKISKLEKNGLQQDTEGDISKSTIVVSGDEEALNVRNGYSALSTGVPQNAESGDIKQEATSTPQVSNNIQGGEQHWVAQFCWGLYYSGGGLIFTSIMLVTVVELFTWMLLAGLASAAGKMLGYRLCGYWGPRMKSG